MRRLLLRLIIIFALVSLMMIVWRLSEVELEPFYPSTPSAAMTQVSPTEIVVSTPVSTIQPTPTQILPSRQTPEAPLAKYPSGEVVFYAENLGIFSMSPDGRNLNRLTNLPSDAFYPFLSPSGRRLGYFAGQRFGEDIVNLVGVFEDGQVYRPTSRSAATCLSPQPYLALWSPDETRMACVSALGSGNEAGYFVTITSFDSQAAPTYWSLWSTIQIKGLVQMTWTSDSQGLVFILNDQGKPQFYLAPLSPEPLGPGEQQQLSALLPGKVALFAQALPGNRMLLAAEDGIYLLDRTENIPALVTDRQAPYAVASFNGDGRFAAIVSARNYGFYVLDLLSAQDRKIGDVPADINPGIFAQTLAWSPDGQFLVFSLPSELEADREDLFVLPRDGTIAYLASRVRILNVIPGLLTRVLWHPSQPYFILLEPRQGGYSMLLVDAQSPEGGTNLALIDPYRTTGINAISYNQVGWRAGQPASEVVDLPLAPPPCQPLPVRISVDNSVYSSLDPPVVSLLYREADFAADAIGSLSPGETAWVLEGPICSGNTNFWLLRAKRSGEIGWAAEATQDSYYLTPRPDAILYVSGGKVNAYQLDAGIPAASVVVADPIQMFPGLKVQFTSPRWTPIGDQFSYLATSTDMAAALYVQNFIEGTLFDLLASLALPSADLPAGAWSPDGSQVVVSLGLDNENRDLYLIQANGSLVQNLTGSPTLDDRSPSWAPDGTRIVYLSGEGVNTEIYVLAPGESITRLTFNNVEELTPTWSPIGNRILFVEVDEGDPLLYTMAPDGGDRILLSAQRGWSPAWSPDGSQIAFTDPESDRLFLLNVNSNGAPVGSGPRMLALAGDDKYPVQPVWAPAGGRIAYVYQNTLYLYDLNNNTTVQVAYDLDNPFIAWQP